MKLFFFCVMKKMMVMMMMMLVWRYPALAESSVSCCYFVLSNGSANYTLSNNTLSKNIWNKDGTPIKDEFDNVDRGSVLNFGINWILLKGNYSGISCKVIDQNLDKEINCTDPCDSGEVSHREGDRGPGGGGDGGGDAGPGRSRLSAIIYVSIFFIVIIVIIFSFLRNCYANTPDASNANGGFHAVKPVEQQNSSV